MDFLKRKKVREGLSKVSKSFRESRPTYEKDEEKKETPNFLERALANRAKKKNGMKEKAKGRSIMEQINFGGKYRK